MKTRYTVALSMIAGAALGGAAIQGLHAQAKPPVYLIGQIDVSNEEGYVVAGTSFFLRATLGARAGLFRLRRWLGGPSELALPILLRLIRAPHRAPRFIY
jgi:hypothetical protein